MKIPSNVKEKKIGILFLLSFFFWGEWGTIAIHTLSISYGVHETHQQKNLKIKIKKKLNNSKLGLINVAFMKVYRPPDDLMNLRNKFVVGQERVPSMHLENIY